MMKTENEKLTPKQKLDKALGISEDQSIDDVLEGLTAEKETAEKKLEPVKAEVQKSLQKIDSELQKASKPDDFQHVDNLKIEESLAEIKSLIDVSKGMILKIYNEISTSSLLDPEMIAAAATLIETARENVADYLALYRSRLEFYDQIRLEQLKQANKKELLRMKYDLENGKAGKSNSSDIPMMNFSQEQIIKILNDEEFKKSSSEKPEA
jgi:hypothetical protein